MSQTKKGSGNDLRILYILGGIVIVALAYVFGFSRLSDKASELDAQNESKQQIVDQLNSMVAQKDEIIKVTEEDISETEKIAKKYPEKYEEEKEIVFLKDLEDNSGINLASINMITNEEVDMTAINTVAASKAGSKYQSAPVSAGASTDTAATAEGENTDTQNAQDTQTAAADDSNLGVAAKTTVEIGFTTKYDDVRSALDYIYAQKDKMGVTKLTLAHNESTGKLDGSMTIVMYSMENIGHEYIVPEPQEILPPINGNIFRSK
ncbi:MAG: hypothetical protein PUB10_05895 [Clostridiales bacterium]|nr:hypothetical protein [Clostridiales bacterium]